MAVDIIFAAVVVYGFYLGYNRGIIRTVLTLLSYLIGLLAAFKFAPDVTHFLQQNFGGGPLMIVAGFVTTFVIAVLIIRLISKGLEGVLKTANINILNRVLGGFLVAATFVLLYSVLLDFGERSNIITPEIKAANYTYPFLDEYPGYAYNLGQRILPILTDFWDFTVDFMDQMQELSRVETVESENVIYEPPEE
jgi:membrane protein required for colicin V production